MSKLKSILTFKCPQCQKGEFFESKNPYNLKKIGNVRECCSECGLKYEREVGFFYGAMYVSYALGVALFVACWVATEVLYPNYSTGFLIGLITVAIIGLGPILYHLSKIIWINLFVSSKKVSTSQGLKK